MEIAGRAAALLVLAILSYIVKGRSLGISLVGTIAIFVGIGIVAVLIKAIVARLKSD